jgi:SAM-dependent methyltransferase
MAIASRTRAYLRPVLRRSAQRLERLSGQAAERLHRPWDDPAPGPRAAEGRPADGPVAATPEPEAAPPGPQPELVTVDHLDDLLRRAYAVEREGGFGERVEFLNGFRLDTGAVALPEDPASPEYAEAQMALYRQISGVVDYDPEVEEVMGVDLEARMRQPAPFDAGSTAAAAGQVMAYGHVLKVLDLRPGDRLLEYGPGQGNLSLMLASIGIRVTAVDISPDFIELIRRRAERDGVEVDAIVGEFGDPPSDGEPVDVIFFYEAFHHSADHAALVRRCRELLRPGGRIVFAGEPIVEAPHRPWHGPWGVRLDGVSLEAIRTHHCLELGFSETYFVRMLMRNGFLVRHHPSNEAPVGSSWVARVNEGELALNALTLPPEDDATWGPGHADPAQTHRFAGPASRLWLDEDPSWSSVDVHLRNHLEVPLSARVGVGSGPPRDVTVLPGQDGTVSVALPPGPRELRVHSEVAASGQEQLGLAVHLVRLRGR